MKKLLWLVIALIIEQTFANNTSTLSIPIYYSQNGKYCAKSIPFGSVVTGKTIIYNTSTKKILYTIPRHFANMRVNHIILSNDGRTLAYFSFFDINSNIVDSLKLLTIYQKGMLSQAYTHKDIIGNKTSNRKQLVYFNKDIYKEKDYENGIFLVKDSVSEQDYFLKDFALFPSGDTIYITDINKIVHKLYLGDGKFYKPESFEDAFCRLKKMGNKNKAESVEVPFGSIPQTKDRFPLLINGDTVSNIIANELKMKAVYTNDTSKNISYGIEINAWISRSGKIQIEKLVIDKKLPYEKIKMFFENSKFNMDFLPVEVEKYPYNYFFCRFRNSNDSIAALETKQFEKERLLERERRMTLDSIEGKYIPKNIEECFVELDKILDSDVKEEMSKLKKKSDMIRYHHGLGTWIRNN